MRAFLYMNKVQKSELIQLHTEAKKIGRTLPYMINNFPMSVRSILKSIRGE
jgi:hypothetical protein